LQGGVQALAPIENQARLSLNAERAARGSSLMRRFHSLCNNAGKTQSSAGNALHKLKGRQTMKNKRAGNRFGKSYIHFDGWPTLGKTGMSLEPNDKNGFRLGFIQINDGGIALYAKKGRTPILRLGWADFIKKCASIATVLVTVAIVGCADPAFQ
jgi:hypothetical protein